MPIYDILCRACGKNSEALVIRSDDSLICPGCGSPSVTRLMSTPSSLTGREPKRMPGPGDTGCCGSSPGHAHCAGPGSCCGRAG